MIIAEILFLGNIIFSYPLTIYITNYVIEYALFTRMKHSCCRQWLKNLTRTLVLAGAIIVGYFLYYYMPKIAGLTALAIGTTVVIVMPSLLNNKYVSENICDSVFNYTLIVYAFCAAVLLSALIIINWDKEEHH